MPKILEKMQLGLRIQKVRIVQHSTLSIGVLYQTPFFRVRAHAFFGGSEFCSFCDMIVALYIQNLDFIALINLGTIVSCAS